MLAIWGQTPQTSYEQSVIEPFAFQDPERWAEFIIFLKGSQQSGVNDLNVIDAGRPAWSPPPPRRGSSHT